MRQIAHAVLLLASISCAMRAQDARPAGEDQTPEVETPAPAFHSRIAGTWRTHRVSPLDMRNSQRAFELIRAGNLYLSLDDAIALALENNLDIELERFLPMLADTDLTRARGGGLLRGVDLLVNETAPGIGGPEGPLLTNLTSGSTPTPLVNTNFSDLALISQQQNNLSVLDITPASNGSAIPQYDPLLTGQLIAQHSTTPENSAVLTGSNWLAQNTITGNAGLTMGFSPGTQVSVSFDNSRYSTDAARYTYNPIVNSSLGFTITQPLLQGFGSSLNNRFIRIARNSRKVADYVFRQQLMDTVSGVARLYTDLVSLNEDVTVKQEAVNLAERLVEDNRNKVEQGTQAPIELTRANAALAASRQALIVAGGLVHQQELVVKNAISRGGLANQQLLEARIIPTTSLNVPDNEDARALADLVSAALRNRPDLASAAIQVENSEIGLQGSRDALRPQLNLVGAVQKSGMAGDPNVLAAPAAGGVTPGGFGTALGQVFRRNYPTYAAGVELSLPLRNRIAQADAVRDELQVRQAQVRSQQLQDQIRLEVADAMESLRQARAAWQAAVEALRLQEQSVAVEQQTFDVGLSTNLEVLQFENYLSQARSTEVASKGAYVKARIALQRATGTILDDNRVSIAEAYRGVVARPPAQPGDSPAK
jgi:outer membrane protein TolC